MLPPLPINVCSEPDAEKHIFKIWPAKAKAQSEQVSID
jgi:hypothetical protein